jgi:hypothetical protein
MSRICRVCHDDHYDYTSWEECYEIAGQRWPWMPSWLKWKLCWWGYIFGRKVG